MGSWNLPLGKLWGTLRAGDGALVLHGKRGCLAGTVCMHMGFGGLVGCMAIGFGKYASEIVSAQSRLGSRVDA